MVELTDAVFVGMAAVVVGGAVVALEAKEIIYGAIGLAFSFFGVAGLFFLLDAPFVAAFQITVYVGAVAVLILFTVMLVREGSWIRDTLGSVERLVGVLTAAVLAVSLGLSFAASALLDSAEQTVTSTFGTGSGIGQLISGPFAPALELVALVLAAAIVGAMMLAKVERKGQI